MMKHIVLITTSYSDRNPGSEAAGSFVEDFAELLSRHLNVTVLAPSSVGGEEKRHINLTIRRFTVPRLPLSLFKPGNLAHWPLIIKTLYSGRQAIQRLADQSKLDYIFAFWTLPSGYWARVVEKSHGISYGVWALGSDIWTLGKIPLIRNVVRAVLFDSVVRFADGYQLKEDVERISSLPCDFLPSARILPSNNKILRDSPPYNLAYLGRWHVNKGTDLLCEALGMLTARDWDKIQEVRICGGGPLERQIKVAAVAMQAKGHPVVLQGYLNKDEAVKLLLWADYVLIPSRIESIPVVFSDAMQTKCPVIAMPVGDLPRLLKTYHVGVLAKESGASAYTAAIHAALEKPPIIFEQDLQRSAQTFDLTQTVRTFLEKTGMVLS
jgi:glycosyltransferase involved in cell wall biosynthesis